MKTTNHTVLITGGSAGIGFEIARLFSEQNNHVIIVGRDAARLQQAAAKLKNVTAIASDVSNESDVEQLTERIKKDFPGLDILINNAGKAYAYNMVAESNTFEKATEEILTNYLSVIRLTEKLLPLLRQQKEAAIVNVSSLAAFAPSHVVSTYSASKAALHSYSQTLRHTLAKDTSIKVFELMPPLVNTAFSQEIGGSNGIAPAVVAADLLTALANDEYEIRVGNTEVIYQLSLSSPAEAFRVMNQAS